MQPRRRGEDVARLPLPAVADEHRVARPGRVVDEPAPVRGPVVLRDALEVRSCRSSEEGRRPDVDAGLRSVASAPPERDERAVRREPQRPDRGVHELGRATVRHVDELTGADLRDPDVHPAVAIGLERGEPPVPRDRGGLLHAVEVGERLEASVRERVLPARAALLPQQRGGEQDQHGGRNAEPSDAPPPEERTRGTARRGPTGRLVRIGVSECVSPRRGIGTGPAVGLGFASGGSSLVAALRETRSAARHPPIERCTEGVHRPDLVVEVAMNGHAFPLLPSLHRRHVSPQVGRDLLPRVQAVAPRLDRVARRCRRGVGHARSSREECSRERSGI